LVSPGDPVLPAFPPSERIEAVAVVKTIVQITISRFLFFIMIWFYNLMILFLTRQIYSLHSNSSMIIGMNKPDINHIIIAVYLV
jgi:hypothetical protein